MHSRFGPCVYGTALRFGKSVSSRRASSPAVASRAPVRSLAQARLRTAALFVQIDRIVDVRPGLRPRHRVVGRQARPLAFVHHHRSRACLQGVHADHADEATVSQRLGVAGHGPSSASIFLGHRLYSEHSMFGPPGLSDKGTWMQARHERGGHGERRPRRIEAAGITWMLGCCSRLSLGAR